MTPPGGLLTFSSSVASDCISLGSSRFPLPGSRRVSSACHSFLNRSSSSCTQRNQLNCNQSAEENTSHHSEGGVEIILHPIFFFFFFFYKSWESSSHGCRPSNFVLDPPQKDPMLNRSSHVVCLSGVSNASICNSQRSSVRGHLLYVESTNRYKAGVDPGGCLILHQSRNRYFSLGSLSNFRLQGDPLTKSWISRVSPGYWAVLAPPLLPLLGCRPRLPPPRVLPRGYSPQDPVSRENKKRCSLTTDHYAPHSGPFLIGQLEQDKGQGAAMEGDPEAVRTPVLFPSNDFAGSTVSCPAKSSQLEPCVVGLTHSAMLPMYNLLLSAIWSSSSDPDKFTVGRHQLLMSNQLRGQSVQTPISPTKITWICSFSDVPSLVK